MAKTASLLAGLLGAFLAAELTARQIKFSRTVFDPTVGHRVFAPGERFVDRTEGNGTGVWQARGVRGVPDNTQESGDVILVLGDSYAEALQVSDEELFTSRLNVLLAQRGHSARIALVGRSGLSVADYVQIAPNYIRLFRPKWVVIQVRDDDFAEDAWRTDGVRFERKIDGSLIVVGEREGDNERQHLAKWWRRAPFSYSAAASFAITRLRDFAVGAGREAPLFSAGQRLSEQQNKGRPTFPLEDELSLLHKAWPCRLTLLYLPPFDLQDPSRKGEDELRLEAATRTQGVELVNLRQSYADFARRGRAPFGFSNSSFNSGHWNAEAHEAAANLLAKVARNPGANDLF